ncbi:MAG: UDP-glucose dehydrogenase family protein [Anaerolineae bacterium]
MHICVIGTGYVGLVTGACFADLGNQVVCLDISERKIEMLQRGEMPIYEPGLSEVVGRGVHAGRLSFTTSYAEGLKDAEVVFIAVGTPAGVDGEADLRYVRSAAEGIADTMDHPLIVINKSTVPVGTGDWVANIIRKRRQDGIEISVVSNPEFLREGSAIKDFLNPDRVVLGSEDRGAAERVAQLYLPLRATIMLTDVRTAEMIKYASNAFLATRISFINEIASICDELGADIKEVAFGMGCDRRIGHHFLQAGLGWGGSCFPKDVKALAHMADLHGTNPQLLRAVIDINSAQRRRVVRWLRDSLHDLNEKVIGILGLAFKPETDDIRESPAIDLIRMLESEGASIRAYDPQAMEAACHVLPNVSYCKDAYDVAKGCDALVLCTEWEEFRYLDWQRVRGGMRGDMIADGRNFYEPETMAQAGFRYRPIGRGIKPF